MQLLRALCSVGRAIQVLARDLLSDKAPRAHELEQGLLDRHLEFTQQLRGQTAAIRARHELLCRINESAESRKARAPAVPQAPVIELGQGVERVELTAVRIAGVVRKFPQFAKDRSVYCSPQRGFHLVHGHNLAAPEQRKQRVSVELGGAHNVRSPPLMDEF